MFDRYGTGLTDDDGRYLGWAWYFRDVTTERDAARESIAAGERFAQLATTLQESLLPPHIPDVPGIEVAARHLPAGSGGELVGDFYDVFQTDRSTWGVVMGDVCGKGVEAAKVTALARYTIAGRGDPAPLTATGSGAAQPGNDPSAPGLRAVPDGDVRHHAAASWRSQRAHQRRRPSAGAGTDCCRRG